MKFYEHHVCVQSHYPIRDGTCQGDSGSPLMEQDKKTGTFKQVGIVASGILCTLYPTYYTKILKYLPWINQNLEEFNSTYERHLSDFEVHFYIDLLGLVGLFGLIVVFFTLIYYSFLSHNHPIRLIIFLEFFKRGLARVCYGDIWDNLHQE